MVFSRNLLINVYTNKVPTNEHYLIFPVVALVCITLAFVGALDISLDAFTTAVVTFFLLYSRTDCILVRHISTHMSQRALG